jgi:hypothetical protein
MQGHAHTVFNNEDAQKTQRLSLNRLIKKDSI